MANYLKPLASLATSLFFITGCSLNPLSSKTGDSTDISISAESVGEVAFQSINETQSTQEILSLQSPAPASLLEQPSLPDFAVDTKQSLGKKNAASEFTIDTIGDIIRITLTTTGILQSKYDTIEVVFDETAFDNIEGNESLLKMYGTTVHTNGTIESYHAEDRDGDGIINGSTVPQKAALNLHTTYKSGIVATTFLEADAGTDNSFDTEEDNRLYAVSWVKMFGDDTLAYAFFDDADGDGIIAATGPGTVNVRFFEKDNPLKPLVDYGKVTVRIKRDSDGNERTLRFCAEEKLVTGRLNRVWVVDKDGDSTLDTGEKAYVHFATSSPAVADSEITAQAVYVIDPGSNFGDATDNLLHEITLAKSYRFGRLDTLTFHATFNPPVPDGQDPAAGSFELEATFRNGKSASLIGTFAEGTIEGTYTGPEGDETEVVLRKE